MTQAVRGCVLGFASAGWPLLLTGLILPANLFCQNSPSETNRSAPAAASAPAAPPLREVGPGLFELGKVRLDKTRRSISFPAWLNMREGPLEYLIVTDYGKTHESLLRTDAQPYHVQLALLLLGARGSGTNAFPESDPTTIRGEKVRVELSWSSAEKQMHLPATEAVFNLKTRSAMTAGPWVYNGSKVVEGTFLPQATGSIVSLILDESCLINNPRPGAEDDEIWTVNSQRELPPLNWPVSVEIQLPKL